jgi:Flp pilus assembly pilin Flp
MIGKAAMNRCFTPAHRQSWINPFRAILTAREGSAPAELAFFLGFIVMVGVTGFVFVGNSVADSLTDVSERIETATANMPNPLGGGSIVVASSGESGGNGGGNGNGNGNGNGKNK